MNTLRSPDTVMHLKRLGASHQTRLSFMRVLLRKLKAGNWQTTRPVWEIDDTGVGYAVYEIHGEGQTYSLVAFAHDLPDDERSDRVIAERWDATFALVDGKATVGDIDRLSKNVPLQEAGRVSDRELVLSRANRSVRLWDHVVQRLAKGEQPDDDALDAVGYLMRTTAVYGSGKFGAAEFETLKGRPVLDGPFRAEMLTVWLIRTFVIDLVHHVARAQGGRRATELSSKLKRRIGIGNSTGLGMAPYLVNHPRLLNAWITARETALARVRALPASTPANVASFVTSLGQAVLLTENWKTNHAYQKSKINDLRGDLAELSKNATDLLQRPHPWNAVYEWAAANLSLEGQEMTASLIIEPHGTLVDDLADTMAVVEPTHRIDGSMELSALRNLIEQNYGWALDQKLTTPDQTARFWYTSEAKLEPRLGERFDEPGAELEQPLAIAQSIWTLSEALKKSEAETVAQFLLSDARHRHTVRRIQQNQSANYAEIRDNLIAADMMPIDMLRCKLAFFGATRFDPRSDRWLRITMFQGAPYPDELLSSDEGWIWPERVA